MRLRRLFWPTLITLLGAFMRWHRLGDMRTLWDHAYPIAQAQQLLSNGEWPAFGQVTTFFLNNPPGQAYLSLIPVAVFGAWWCAIWFFTTLNVLAVPLLYRLGHDLFGKREAIIGACLLAVSPWVAYYSRATWSGSLTPIATTLILTLLLPALSGSPRRRNGWRIFAAFVVLTIFTQSYLLALFIVPLQTGLLLVMRARQVAWRAIAAGGMVFAAVTGIYIYNLARDWPNQTARLTRFVQAAEGPLELRSGALYLAVIYVTGLDFRTQPLPPEAVPPIMPPLTTGSAYAVGGALALGVVLALRSLGQRDREAWANASLLVWWLTPVALLSFTHRGLYPWHAMTTLPAGHLLAARGIDWIWDKRRWLTPLLLIGGVFTVGVSFANLEVDHAFNAAYPIYKKDDPEAFDRLTLRSTLRIGEVTRQLADAYRIREAFTRLPEPDLAAWSQRPINTTRWFADPDLLIVPEGQASLYVRLGRGAPPPPFELAQRAALLDFPANDYVAFDIFPAMDRDAMLSLPQTRLDWPSNTGRTCLGYTLSGDWRVGHAATVTTYWLIEHFPENYTEFLYGPYLHLNTAEGATLVNASAPGLEGFYHRLGHLYIQPIHVSIPADAHPGQYQLELGLYDGVHQAGATFFPPNDTPRPFYTTTVVIEP